MPNVTQVSGGWSCMLRRYLELQLLSDEAGLMSTGVPLDLCGKAVLLYANLRVLLSDGDGLRSGLQWVGANGIKPCFRHYNVMKKHSGRAVHDDTYVEIGCCEPGRFRVWPEGELRAAIDAIIVCRESVALGTIPKARLETMQQAFGFTSTRDGILASAELRALVSWQSVARYDWVHTFLCDGVLTGDAWGLIEAAGAAGLATQADLCVFLKQKWLTPYHRMHNGRTLHRIFNAQFAASNEKAGHLKCSASELLSLYVLLRHWAEAHLPIADERIAEHAKCFFTACAAVDMLLMAKRHEIPMGIAGVALRAALVDHMRASIALYGADRPKPKNHWAFDVCDQLESDAWLWDTFVVERLHLRVRAVAEKCCSLQDYERTVLSGVVNLQAARANTALGVDSSSSAAPFPGLPGAFVSDSVNTACSRFRVGDFVLHGDAELGCIVACAIEAAAFYLVVDEWSKIEDVTAHSSTWRGCGRRCVWPATDVQECAAWQEQSADIRLVLRM